MALLKGKGAMTGVNLLAKVYDNGKTKDGKSHYADIQVDARDPRGPEQINLHLKSERVQRPDGEQGYTNTAPYSIGQMEEIIKAAGPNKEPLLNQANETVGTVYGFKGNVMPATRGTGLVVNTKSLEASEFKVDAKTVANQFASMKEAKKAHSAAKETQTTAPEHATDHATEHAAEAAEAIEQTVEVEVEEPAVG